MDPIGWNLHIEPTYGQANMDTKDRCAKQRGSQTHGRHRIQPYLEKPGLEN